MTTTIHVQLSGLPRTTANLESITTAADVDVWRSAAELLRERTYATDDGAVRVRIDWDAPFEVQVDDERENADAGDASSFVSLFFHDAFLLLNLAVPGSFGGVLAMLSDGTHRSSEVTLSARMFEYAWATAERNGGPVIEPLPLREVMAWYDALQIGTQQIATDGVVKALFALLHLARGEEDESMSMFRLGQALEALSIEPSSSLASFFALRNALVDGTAPVLHPLADDGLDPRVDDQSLELVNASDLAASVIVGALQARIRAL